MTIDGLCKLALAAALAPLILSGCATQAASSATPSAAANKTVAAAPAVAPLSPAVQAPQMAAAHAAKPLPPLPAPTELELAAGVQITHIGVTASGGLVDARFKVIDADKATALLGNPANAPMLIAGDKPPLMAPHHALKPGHYAKDQYIYILYPNLRGAVQPGTAVSVAMGQTRIGPVTAQ